VKRKFSIDFPRAYGAPVTRATIKATDKDFQVDEVPGYVCTGEGEHCLLRVRKSGANTVWVAEQIARFAGIKTRDVGFAGRKDRNALTTQWFSCWLPGRDDPEWQDMQVEGVEVLEVVRHNRKLKTGALKSNRFKIVITGLTLDADLESALQDRLEQIKSRGVPNYFGEQRFGIDSMNLVNADRMLNNEIRVRNRQKRSIYLSAARSYLFNLALAQRVNDGSWCQRKESGGSQIGSLFGKGDFDSGSEKMINSEFADWCTAMDELGMKRSYRALALDPVDLEWQFCNRQSLSLEFELPRGSFATALIRELVETNGVGIREQFDE
jgi:tRNA pseudouridine13 synthase